MKSNYRRIGDFIELVDVRNEDLAVDRLLGLSISKQFIPSVANTVGTNMKRYKIIKKNQFACSIMQVRRDKKMPVAILKDFEEAIISQAYPVFQVIDETELLPDYLMMWFSRSEYDRQATFWAVGGVRGSLEWEDFLNFELPIPPIEEQRAIVAEYQTVTNRIQLNEQINAKLEETAQALYRHWFVDFEFPNESGKPYKSSGGKMVWNEELEKEVPEGWEVKRLSEVSTITAGGDKPADFSEFETEIYKYPVYSNSSKDNGLYGYTSKPKILKKSITISARGAIIGFTKLRTIPFVPIVRLIVVIPNKEFEVNYLYSTIQKFSYHENSSAQGQLTVPEISNYHVLIPSSNILEDYDKSLTNIYWQINSNDSLNISLMSFSNILLSKMATDQSLQKATAI